MPIVALDRLQQFAAVNILLDPGAIPGPVVIPNCVQVIVIWALADGKIGRNILYGRTAGVPAPTPAQCDAIQSALTSGALWTAFAAHLSVQTSFSGVRLKSVHVKDQPEILGTLGSVPGTNPATAMPAEMAVCVSLKTALTNPANRGRMYIPGYAVDAVSGANLISGPVVADTQAWAAQLMTVLPAQGMTFVIGHKARAAYTGSTGRDHPARDPGSVDITQVIVRDNHWDSQRRRGLR